MEASDAGPSSFRRGTLEAAERTLRLPTGGASALIAGEEAGALSASDDSIRRWLETLGTAFADGGPLTPRQAFKLSWTVAGFEDDGDFGWNDYLQGRLTVDDLQLLSELPDWVLFIANNVWLQRFRDTCRSIGDRIDRGQVPYPRCLAERAALWLMINSAEEQSSDVDEVIDDDDEKQPLLPANDERDEDWETLRDDLFNGDLDFELIWYQDATRLVFSSGAETTGFHPFRWWESDGVTVPVTAT